MLAIGGEPSRRPEGVAEGRRSSGKRPGGYGIAMAKAAMSDIFYNQAGNTVVITKRLKKEKDPGAARAEG